MDRRGFIGSGVAAGIAGAVGATGLAPLLGSDRYIAAALSTARRERAGGPLRLNSNENPLGLAPVAREAVRNTISEANRYPRALQNQLITTLAERLGVTRDHVVLGNGSTEILQMTIQAMETPGAPLIMAEPTFEAIMDYQLPYAYDVRGVPVTADYAHDVGRMREAAERAHRPAVVYICNPNNPTGTVTPSAELDAWIEEAPESVFFMMDEAYLEYVEDAGYWSALPWVHRRPNLVVVRTFSKIFGMAGLRLGFGVAHPDTATRLREFISSNNANQLALAAALASLDDEGLVSRSLAVNREARAVTEECLDELGLEHLPSHTNFLMHEINGDLGTYIERMAEAGVGVGRQFPPMLGYNRLSMGLPEEMSQWADTLRSFRAKGWV